MEFKKIALSFVVAFSLCTVTAQAQDAVKCDKAQQEQACQQTKKCPKHAKACCDKQPAKPCCKKDEKCCRQDKQNCKKDCRNDKSKKAQKPCRKQCKPSKK